MAVEEGVNQNIILFLLKCLSIGIGSKERLTGLKVFDDYYFYSANYKLNMRICNKLCYELTMIIIYLYHLVCIKESDTGHDLSCSQCYEN